MPTTKSPFEDIPELCAPEDITAWLEEKVQCVQALKIDTPDTVETFSLTFKDDTPEGVSRDAKDLNKFTLAVVLADWSCYADQENREEYSYLKSVFAVCPRGFRLWLARLDGTCLPIGYTGFHPISKDTFARIQNAPQSITNRKQITPEPESHAAKKYYYIYNIGIIKQFQRSSVSKRLVQAFAKDLASVNAYGLAAIVVSPDGQRVIEKFGLHQTGVITHDGHSEMAFASESIG
ncbi:GNAT family N-acetyltransferase [Desulfovibrio aerotolerans]|uniref:GNAT family N-acetyltransferase n=1 Tax=Solidesulfovibrio aerotolerans TaxID=295255 RepID=A0A7C9ML97_9BACT|nr:GNAT family N-acetyltransferase [Solidesulfovibrio aerotolerans]